MRQVHGDKIVEVSDRSLKEAGEADGMITSERDIFLAVLTADCVPILLVAPKNKIVAAVHAGWRGTLAGIAQQMVQRFEQQYRIVPSELEAALGPAIGVCCYEVKDDVAKPLMKKWGSLTTPSIQIREGKIIRQFTPPEPRYSAGRRRAREPTPRNRPVYKLRTGRVFLYRRQGGERAGR
jgi:YfiH family protein